LLSDLGVRSWSIFFKMRISHIFLSVLVLLSFSGSSSAQLARVAHLSDLHIGLSSHPGAEQRLKQAIDLIRPQRVDAVIVTGDIGDKFERSWKRAKSLLASLNVPVYYVPGNHDDTAKTSSRYTAVLGRNYYTFRVKGIQFVALDSQLLGNFSDFQSPVPLKVGDDDKPAAEQMLAWLDGLQFSGPVIAVQHVPPDRRSPETSPDEKPYWILHDPWRRRELDGLRKLGVKDILAGHWHQAAVYDADGFTIHVAPATSWSPKSPLGFALHSISREGKVTTEFVYFERQPFLP